MVVEVVPGINIQVFESTVESITAPSSAAQAQV